MKSIVVERGAVPFAEHTGERVYMREFRKADGLPFDLARWQPTVDAMLAEVDTDGPIYLMVDQRQIPAGTHHRRPGVHIDGYWIPGIQAHGGSKSPSRHTGNPSPTPDPGKHNASPRPRKDHHSGQPVEDESDVQRMDSWRGATYEYHEGLLLASNVRACRALAGEFIGAPGEGGDCAHIDTRHMQEIIMQPGVAYAGNVTMLHESLPVPFDCLRTVVRLNVPGWTLA